MNESLVALEQLPGSLPHVEILPSLTNELCGIFDEFSTYHSDDFDDKSKCFDYGDLIKAREIEDNLGIDVGIIPTLMDIIPMTDHCVSNGIWT